MEYLVDPNFKIDYGSDSYEEVEDDEMVCKYDNEDEEMLIIHFKKDNLGSDEGTVFESVEDCRFGVATFSINVGF